MNFSEVMNFIVDRRAANIDADELGIIFDRLIWATDDNGSEICEVKEEWLMGTDERRIEIALSMENTFPFETVSEMARVFTKISERFPHFSKRCSEILKKRQTQGG